MTQQQEQTPLFGDKALELFFAGNPAPVATAMWATAMRNSYEERLAAAHLEVERLRAKIAYYEAPLPMGEGGVYTITTDHRFTDEGICVRCGEDAEQWDAGCVEAIVNDAVKARAELAELRAQQQYVPVEDGHYPLTFVQLTIADNNDGRKYISIWDEEFDRQVGCALPDDWAVCRLAPQQDEGENHDAAAGTHA